MRPAGITRIDGREFFFTDHDRDLVFDADVARRARYSRTAIVNDSSPSFDNLDVEGVFDSVAITEEELRAGLFDQAEVRIFLLSWANPSMGALRMRRGCSGRARCAPGVDLREERLEMFPHQAIQDRFLWLPPLEVDCVCGCGAQRWFALQSHPGGNARTTVPRHRDPAGEAQDESRSSRH